MIVIAQSKKADMLIVIQIVYMGFYRHSERCYGMIDIAWNYHFHNSEHDQSWVTLKQNYHVVKLTDFNFSK